MSGAILASALTSLALGLAPQILGTLFQIFSALVFRTIHVSSSRHVAIVDQEIERRGYKTTTAAGPAGLPSQGIHFLWDGGVVIASRWAIDNRAFYRIFILGRRAHREMNRVLNGDAREVSVREMTYASATRRVPTIYPVVAPAIPREWQNDLARELEATFTKTARASVLIYGPPGVGKSRFAQVLALRLRERGGRDPVISIFDPTARGGALDDTLRNPQPTRPVILLWDEIETAIAHAEGNMEIRGDAVSLARNRPSLLHCLDRLEQTRHIVLVATTNRDPAELEPAYVRNGRLTRHIHIGG